jgi:hypothetical protein
MTTGQKYRKPMTYQRVYNFDFGDYKLFHEEILQIVDCQFASETVLQTLNEENPCFCEI